MCSSSKQPQKLSPVSQVWRPWEQPKRKAQIPPSPVFMQHASQLQCGFNDDCKVTFKRESELKRHTLSKHFKRREHCKECRKVFTRKDNLTRHIKLAHTGDEKPRCKFCSKILSRRDAVQRHESTCPKNPSKKEKSTMTELEAYPSHLQRLEMKHQKSQLSLQVKYEAHLIKTDIGLESG